MTNEEAKKIMSQMIKDEEEFLSDNTVEAHKMAIRALEQTTWIPVSERLPEKYTYTLWCASSGYVRSDYFNGEYWEDAKKLCYDVIAWMPLPTSYQGE